MTPRLAHAFALSLCAVASGLVLPKGPTVRAGALSTSRAAAGDAAAGVARRAPRAEQRAAAAAAAAALAAVLAASPAVALDGPPLDGASAIATFEPRGVTAVDSVVFVIGTVPFLWAAWEFWRRIAVGASFGTGADSIVIRDDDASDQVPDEDQVRRFGGRRVLGADAIYAARALMAVAGGSVALALFAAGDVLR